MSEIREYSYVHLTEKTINPVQGPKTVLRSSVQLKADPRVRIYRDMDHPETLVCEAHGDVIEYPWTLVVAARVQRPKVLPLPNPDDGSVPLRPLAHPRR